MTVILILLIGGILIGRLLSRQRKVIQTFDRLTTWAIYLLLFLLGISIGSNHEIISNLGSLGIKALIIAGFSVAGSILLSMIIYRLFFKTHGSEETDHGHSTDSIL